MDPLGRSFPDLPQAESDDVVCLVAVDNCYEKKFRDIINTRGGPLEQFHPRAVQRYRPMKEINFLQESIGKNPDYMIAHHMAHVFAAQCYRHNDDERLFLSYDGTGHDAELYMTCFMVGRISNAGFNLIEDATPIPTSVPLVGLLGYNSAGKAMGLAGYMPRQEWTGDMALKLINLSLNERYEATYPNVIPTEMTDENYQFVANFYRWYTEKIWWAVEDNLRRFSLGNGVLIGGGTTLALEINSNIYEREKNVIFAPPTDDSGCALGAAAFAYWLHNKRWPRLNTVSLNELQSRLPKVGPQQTGEIA